MTINESSPKQRGIAIAVSVMVIVTVLVWVVYITHPNTIKAKVEALSVYRIQINGKTGEVRLQQYIMDNFMTRSYTWDTIASYLKLEDARAVLREILEYERLESRVQNSWHTVELITEGDIKE